MADGVGRRKITLNNSGLKSTGQAVDLNLAEKLMKGGIPPSLLGETQHGGSIFSNIAHRTEQSKRFNNLVNNGVDSQVFLQVKDAEGHAIKTPYMMNGKQYYPDAEGNIRIANSTNVKLAKEIRDYQENKTDKIMELCILGDDIAAYILGVDPKRWAAICGVGGFPPGGENWEKELKDEKCSIDYIESLVDGSISQTKALSKLRKVIKCYLNNVNLEDFDNVVERKADMGKGTNNPFLGGDEEGAVDPDALRAAKAALAGKK